MTPLAAIGTVVTAVLILVALYAFMLLAWAFTLPVPYGA